MDPLCFICIFSSLPSTRPFGSSLALGSVGTPKLSKKGVRAFLGWVIHCEVLAWLGPKVDNTVLWRSQAWDVVEPGSDNFEVKRERGQSIPRIGDPLGSSARVSSQKKNREGMVRAQSGQYHAMAESSSGCDNF
ncbi:unnamed protein product [Malus baccata var. baccata]